jgi:cytoskeletal protein CcmA (bactofilin family)
MSSSVEVRGYLLGDITVANVTVDTLGSVIGNVDACAVEVRGRLSGSIRAQIINLSASAIVDGDLTYGQLTIALGARFSGRCVYSCGISNSAVTASGCESAGWAETH